MKNTLFTFVLFCLLLITSCAPKTFAEVGGTIVTCQFPDMKEKGETPEAILNILRERVQSIEPSIVTNVSYDSADASFVVEVPIVKGEIVDLLFAHGEMSINEVVIDARRMMLAGEENDSLISLLSGSESDLFSNAFFQASTVTAGINLLPSQKNEIVEMLNSPSIKSLYPVNTRFIWSYEDVINGGEAGRVNYLHAINTKSKINLNETIGSSNIENSDYGAYIHLILNKTGGQQFYELTKKNVGFPLAIVCDDMVLSSPNVNDAIEGGNMTISGNFDLKTLAVIKALLSPNTIKSAVKIVDRKEVEGER